MKFGGFNRQFDIDSHFDFEGIHYVFKMALFGVGIIGVLHVGLGVVNWLYPGLSRDLGKVVHASELDRNEEARVLTRGIFVAMDEMGAVISGVQNSMASAYSGVMTKVTQSVVPTYLNAQTYKVDLPPAPPSEPGLPAEPPAVDIASTPAAAPNPEPIQTVSPEVKTVAKQVKTEDRVKAPQITADSYLIADMKTGKIFLEKNSDMQYQIASISKLITALTADKVFGSSDDIYISEEAVKTASDAGNIKAGEIFLAKDLLYPMLLESSNDAAMAYALQYDLGHSEGAFVKEMADLSKRIGLAQTSLVEPTGLSPDNISTAKDLFELARYISDHDPRIFSITKIESLEIAQNAKTGHHILKNNNVFSKRSDFVGGKTGKTETAKETMLSVFKTQTTAPGGPEEDTNIAIIVLRSTDRKTDTEKLYRWYTEKYKNV